MPEKNRAAKLSLPNFRKRVTLSTATKCVSLNVPRKYCMVEPPAGDPGMALIVTLTVRMYLSF